MSNSTEIITVANIGINKVNNGYDIYGFIGLDEDNKPLFSYVIFSEMNFDWKQSYKIIYNALNPDNKLQSHI